MEKIGLGIGIILMVFGVKMIYDSRLIVKQYFSFGDVNEATLGLKILGFMFSIMGGILVYFNF